MKCVILPLFIESQIENMGDQSYMNAMGPP
jgi:hypothetical protein